MRTLGQKRLAAAPAWSEPQRAPSNPRPRLAADRYSRRVALLKRVLPAVGLSLLLLVAAWPRLVPLWESVRLPYAAIDLREAKELRMIDPRYAGVDRLNRPYVVTAAVGRQLPDRNDLMSLDEPRAQLLLRPDAMVVVTAATGIYQSQAQLLDLFGNVTLTHQNGTHFVTARAHVDLATDIAEGHDPITGAGPSGNIDGQGFRVSDRGDTVIFTGRSHLLLKPAKPSRPPEPPTLPPRIEQAAQIIAAAAPPVEAAPAPISRKSATAHQTHGPRRPAHLSRQRARTTHHAG
ncbi:MAG TPA: LPS export ABC transporter periplasmic protein LptC [Stellaceae bacterium]|jgi:lipopolysaccharide export system protein LptC